MDSSLVKEFRQKVNDQNWILQMYRNRDGKDQWSIVCSAMDWLETVVGAIDKTRLSRNNDNDASLKMVSFIAYIGIMWECVQQLHRVFINKGTIPFKGDSSVFQHKLFPATDNKYFKTIRACFAAHPVNINDSFNGRKEKRYASWSGGTWSSGDFSVFLYSNEPQVNQIELCIYFDELMEFAEARYHYLHTIMDSIDRWKENYILAWQQKPIRKSKSEIEQIKILIEEAQSRLDSEYYSSALDKLYIVFSTPISDPKNQIVVAKYRSVLRKEIDEICSNLQAMEIVELKSDQYICDDAPEECMYSFSKLVDSVYGEEYPHRFLVTEFSDFLSGIVEYSDYMSIRELYVITLAGFYCYNSNRKEASNS